jgi:hypothetical protein
MSEFKTLAELTTLNEGDVTHVNFGKLSPVKGKMEPISMMQAFGSEEMNIVDGLGIRLTEKPSYWEDFEGDGYAVKRNIHDKTLKMAEKAIGRNFKEYSAKEVYGTDMPGGPQVSVKKMPAETMCIIKMGNGDRYLVDTSQARTYIRMWTKIS